MKLKLVSLVMLSAMITSCSDQDHNATVTTAPTTDTTSTVSSTTISTFITRSESTTSDEETPNCLTDRMYQISKLPKIERAASSDTYGKVDIQKGLTVSDGNDTLDFSIFQNDWKNIYIPYCINRKTTTVYFADWNNIYQTDPNFHGTKLLVSLSSDDAQTPDWIETLVCFDNTDKLLFLGYHKDKHCVGWFNTKECSFQFIENNSMQMAFANNGVLLYDNSANYDHRESIALYCEQGMIYEIPFHKAQESESPVQISANGLYICTQMQGKSEDGHLVERYSIYDVKSGKQVNYLDWTFKDVSYTDSSRSKGFTYIGIDERNHFLYLQYSIHHTFEFYKYYFGE